MSSDSLTIVVGVAAIFNASALVYDVYRRHKTKLVSFVQVPNKSADGVEEFRTRSATHRQGTEVERITINSDNTVEIKKESLTESYGHYIKWRS